MKNKLKIAKTVCEKCNKPFSYDPNEGEPALCRECQEKKAKLEAAQEAARKAAVKKTAKCKECGEEFVITVGEAEWYETKGLDIPARCSKCRAERKRLAKKAG